MNELNKLIEQYERENPGKKAKYQWQDANNEDQDDWSYGFVLWLACRPTCGKEQRLFLDEVEKFSYDSGDKIIYKTEHFGDISIIFQDDFTADLQKVIKGE